MLPTDVDVHDSEIKFWINNLEVHRTRKINMVYFIRPLIFKQNFDSGANMDVICAKIQN